MFYSDSSSGEENEEEVARMFCEITTILNLKPVHQNNYPQYGWDNTVLSKMIALGVFFRG